MSEIVIHDGNAQLYIPGGAAATNLRHGLIPRDLDTHPKGCYAFAPAYDPALLPTIPQSEWSERLKEMNAKGELLSNLRMTGMPDGSMIPSRDQNGKGYCWAHSSTSACMMIRAIQGDPYADLSAYMVACIIKGYRDEGGNGIESLDFIAQKGIADSKFWPQQSMSRSNDTPAMWADAAGHKVTGEWRDLGQQNFNQTATMLLMGHPVVVDYNWWSHSVCAIDLVENAATDFRTMSGKRMIDVDTALLTVIMEATGGFGVRIWNSWGDSWSDHGMGVLAGSKAIPDDQCAPLNVLPSAT